MTDAPIRRSNRVNRLHKGKAVRRRIQKPNRGLCLIEITRRIVVVGKQYDAFAARDKSFAERNSTEVAAMVGTL